MKLECSILQLGYIIIDHGNGDGISMDIDLDISVQDLLNKIEERHSQVVHCHVDDLQLYIAKKKDRTRFEKANADATWLILM